MSEIKHQPFLKIIKDTTSKFTKIKKQDYLESGKYKIIDQGKKTVAGYTNSLELINNWDEDIIIFGDHTRAIKYIDFPIAIGADGVKVLKIDSTKADTKYIYYFLKSVKLHNAGYSRHFKYLKAIKLPIQSLEHQRKISTFLTQIEELIQKREESIRLLDELIKSTFLNMFGDPFLNPKGWDIEKLKDLTLKITDGVHHKPNYTTEGTPFISVKDITTGYLKFDNCKYIDIHQHMKFSTRCKVEKNDILYTKVGATYGRACIVDTDVEFSLYVSVALLKPNHKKINYIFLKEQMITKGIIHQANKSIKGIGVPDLHLIEIKKFKIIVPPKPLQDKFAKIITKLEQTKEIYHESLEELENFFNSTAQKAFKGELDISKIDIKQIQEKEALIMLDKKQVLELIKQGDFDPKDYVSEEQSYDSIRDMIIGTKDKKGLIDDGSIEQEFYEKDKKEDSKIILRVK